MHSLAHLVATCTCILLFSVSCVFLFSGQTRGTLLLYINPDSVPELDEVFEVELLQVSESNQALDPAFSTANVTVLKNDNPEGMFSFSSSSAGPYVVMESIDAEITLEVVRTGGALTTESISHVSSPSREYSDQPCMYKWNSWFTHICKYVLGQVIVERITSQCICTYMCTYVRMCTV